MGSSSRYLNNYLDAYLHYTEETEPPKTYHIWCCISMIAAAMQRRLWMSRGHETIYPNLYIVLVGPSGKARKGTALAVMRDILKDTGIPMTAESITKEALIREMKNHQDKFISPEGVFKFHCSLTAISPELSVFLKQNNIDFLADLTDWYDSHDSWTYQTKGAGTDQIQGVCFNLIGATAPDWLKAILPNEAIGGGFTSRIIFVMEDRKRKTVARPHVTEEMHKLRGMLVSDLERVTTLAGEMQFTPDAEDFYTSWYEQHDRELQSGDIVHDPAMAGYYERKQTHLQKVAMVLSAARADDLIVTKEDLEKALRLLTAIEAKMPGVFAGVGESNYARVTERALVFIHRFGEVSRSEMMRYFYRDMDVQTLALVEQILEQMKVVEITIDPQNREKIYRYVGPD